MSRKSLVALIGATLILQLGVNASHACAQAIDSLASLETDCSVCLMSQEDASVIEALPSPGRVEPIAPTWNDPHRRPARQLTGAAPARAPPIY
jgi:hypothetical protein